MRDRKESRERRKKKELSLYGILLLFLLLIMLFLSTRVHEINVIGNEQYTKEELINMILSKDLDYNSLYAFMEDRIKPHKSLPFIEKYELHWKSPCSLEIIVYEKNMVGYVEYMSSNLYFDGDGVVVESTQKKLPGIPKITGLSFSKVSLYKALPVENKAIFQDILNLSSALRQEKIECDHIDYSASSTATLYIGGIKVLLGDHEDMEQKLMSLKDILPALAGRKGTLDLSKYRGRKEKEAYVFKEEK